MADKVLPQRVSMLGRGLGGLPSGWWTVGTVRLPQSWDGGAGSLSCSRNKPNSSLPPDSGACPRVSGVHGSLGF